MNDVSAGFAPERQGTLFAYLRPVLAKRDIVLDYPQLAAYMGRILAIPGARETVNIDHIKEVLPWFKSTYMLKMADRRHSEVPVSRAQTKRLRELLKM